MRHRGFINTVWIHKVNENRYGLLFIDGYLLSLTRPIQNASLHVKPHKHGDDAQQNINTPCKETSTPSKDDPKTPHPKRPVNMNCYDAVSEVWEHNAEMRDMWLRAQQIKAQQVEQVA